MVKILIYSHGVLNPSWRQKFTRLSKLNHIDLVCICPNKWTENGNTLKIINKEEYPIHQLTAFFQGHIPYYFYNASKIKTILEDFQPEVIYSEVEPWAVASYQLVKLKQKYCPNAKLVQRSAETFTARNIDNWVFKKIKKFVLSSVDRLIVPSRLAREHMCNFYKGDIIIIPNHLDTDIFKPINRDPNPRLVIGYVGRIVPEKGLTELFKAVKQFEIVLYVIGDGPKEYIDFLKQKKTKCTVKWFGHIDDQLELSKLYNQMDIFVLPSRKTTLWEEYFGRVLIEAMGCGVAVIGSDSGAIPEVIGDSGLIFKQRDFKDLRDKINHLRIDDFRKIYRQNALLKSQRYSVDIIAKQLKKNLLTVLYSASPAI